MCRLRLSSFTNPDVQAHWKSQYVEFKKYYYWKYIRPGR
jgi:hypothetical protein